MPRHNPRRPIFPSEDGAFASTARADIPPTRTTANPTATTTTTTPTALHHHRGSRRVGIGAAGGQGRGLGHPFAGRGGAVNAGNRNLRDVDVDVDAEEEFEGLDEEDFDEEGDSELDDGGEEGDEGGEEGEEDGEGGEEVDEDYEMMDDQLEKHTSAPIPPNLREISSLASWTVSTHKPGCGIAALRHPSPLQFWQSDGPQPHTLTLHFFKRVAVVRIRVYLDFELDESYTPTKMMFLAGMGGNDLVEFATWQGEAPCGWVDIPLDGVGGSHQRRARESSSDIRRDGKTKKRSKRRPKRSDGSVPSNDSANSFDENDPGSNSDNTDDEEEEDLLANIDDEDDLSAGNILKAMVIQARICENHQNGKDTHVRGFQVFARDDRYYTRTRRDSTRKSLRTSTGVRKDPHTESTAELESETVRMDESEWFLQPEIR